MGQILVVNWSKPDDGMYGGVETTFSDLSNGLNAKFVSLTDAIKSLAIDLPQNYYHYAPIDRSYVISKYLSEYEKMFDIDCIITSDDCPAFWDIMTPIISVAQNPYKIIWEDMYNRNLCNTRSYYEFAKFYPEMQKMALKKAKEIVSISKFMSKYVKDLGFDSNIIEWGVDTELFKPVSSNTKDELKEKYGIPKDKKVIVSIQKFIPLKWHFIPQFVDDFKDIFFLIVLIGTNVKKVRSENVKVLKPIQRNILPEIYNLADIYIQPSLCESFGLCCLEAMSCNIPVLTTKTGWFWDAEAEGDYGEAIKEWKYENYKEALERMLKNIEDPNFYKPRQVILDNNATLERCIAQWKELLKLFS